MKRVLVAIPLVAVCSAMLGYGLGTKDMRDRTPVVIPIVVEQSPTASFIDYEEFKKMTPEQKCADGGPSAPQIIRWVEDQTRGADFVDETTKKKLVADKVVYYDKFCRLTYRLNEAKRAIETKEE